MGPRCGRHSSEMQPRCGREEPRCGRDAAEMRPLEQPRLRVTDGCVQALLSKEKDMPCPPCVCVLTSKASSKKKGTGDCSSAYSVNSRGEENFIRNTPILGPRLEYVFRNSCGIRPKTAILYGIRPFWRSFGIRGIRIHRVGAAE